LDYFFWKKTQRLSHDYHQNQTAPVQSSSGVRPGKEMSDVRTRERHAAFIRYRELPSIVTVEPDE
jgi:hypothetical protein